VRSDDISGAQPAHALQAGRRRQADLVGQGLVRDQAVALQDPQDALVEGIESSLRHPPATFYFESQWSFLAIEISSPGRS